MRIVKDENLRLGILITKNDMQKGLSFYSENSDFIQVGIWGYDKGKNLLPHIHNRGMMREIDRTQEVIYVIQGMVKSFIFSEDGKLIEEIILEKGDMLILLNGGHGYEILADDTFVLEVKNGPFMGADKDRKRICV